MNSLLLTLAVLAQTSTPASDADAAPQAPVDVKEAAAEEDEELAPWSGSFGLGFSLFTGNTDEFMLTGNALADHESPEWAATLEADGAYGEAAASEEEDGGREVNAKELGGWARGEYRATPMWSAYGKLGAEADHPANLELRTEVEAGVGITLLEQRVKSNELFLRGYLGAHFAKDRRFEYGPEYRNLPDVDHWSPAVGVAFRYDINERVKLREDASLHPKFFGDERVLLDSTTKLSVNLTGRFAITTFFSVKHDSAPAEGAVRTDTALTLGGEFTL
ncbi:DUF481 domain-containing protein [Pyxidicoccus parkwayensis]|uniref:DUF481 domain-containing protein n=1 Tax=Pyxidicoccus parkwayensis TaxID=2813578 RepID=A0ABX7P840_9BACT|nr:DUF481 domain-containing protein [Pyxidicoccus parkwaysis]QSQ26678.1 DUF481 domain-containing protein [Pyxidicoccus parkwaysis]